MNIYSRENQLIDARFTYQPANLLTFPSTVEITDPWENGGSGVGNGSHALRSAVGEFFERQHFYVDVVPDLRSGLSYSLSEAEVSKFTQAFSQTKKQHIAQSALSAHQYNLSQVFRLSDLSSCYIPTACITLSSVRTETENVIYPLRDTCGCAFGWHPEHAILGSLKESLERQFLLKFWLTGICVKVIDAPTTGAALAGTGAETLRTALARSGQLSFIDISESGYPGTCILAVYGQQSQKHNVHYCAGMAYAPTLELAMEKSLLELWQTYRFIDLFQSTGQKIENIHDSYLRYFLHCNRFEIYEDIISVQTQELAPSHFTTRPFSLTSLLNSIARHNALGYIYLKAIPIEDGLGYCSKFVSPDFFMHMNNSQHINLKNLYSEPFFQEILPARAEQMVPFP
ncbi:YcaO-like family protein [Pseudomonas sp. NFACC37-1]|uniref:YcaO-like family protein n=1 Tax=Pseudomonas sp. NFACC37-1 TaxID=1566196 RepID=UPI000889030E|nr:YcaO-like family protein [Pseudomonas sp. NFACC37-1]SCZ09933.1 YcaO-like family protein [Pseudomonas sp. NFACC37-1]